MELTKMTNTNRPMVRIHNLETDEIIDREMTNAEFAQYEAEQTEVATKKAEAEANAIAKSALLNKLGITEDEAKLLLS
jgi:hypothetical protein